MSPTGQFLGRIVPLMSKYGIDISQEAYDANILYLTKQLWKLIPMREEEDPNWAKQLDTAILNITGLHEIFKDELSFLQLLEKLEGIRITKEIPFDKYRKGVFEAIALLRGSKNEKK